MKPLFSNATVMWNEREIARRESLIREIPLLLLTEWRTLNPAVQMVRVETPVLLPAAALQSHIDANFDLIRTETRGYLRPETTAGSYAAAQAIYPQAAQLLKATPLCVWQVGLSFRDEAKAETMRASKLRLVQFYQMEFQLIIRKGSHANYLGGATDALAREYGGDIVAADELPHYSSHTIDWQMGGLEVAGCSMRGDFPHPDLDVCEIAIGLDRLVAMQLRDKTA